MKISLKQKKAMLAGSAVLIIASVLAQLSALVSSPSSSEASSVMLDFTLQEAGSDNVYQQQVSALWAIKDLLGVTADQNAAIIQYQSVVSTIALATLIIVGFVLWITLSVHGEPNPPKKKVKPAPDVTE
jgi:hypothetical protein